MDNHLADRLHTVIPRSLAESRRWLIWKRRARRSGAKFDKVPYYADGTIRQGVQNSEADLAHMVTMAEALEAMKAHKAAGVGFAFGQGCGFTAVDLDGCVVNGVPNSPVFDAADGYAEISPSGTGLRLITEFAGIGDFKNHEAGVEVFETTGFVTITGDVLRDADIGPMGAALREAIEAHRVKAPERRAPSKSLGPASVDEVGAALRCIPASCGHKVWIDVAMALHSEGLPFELFHEWSAGGGKLYQGEADCLKAWNSLHREGITIGTLFYYAKEHGWKSQRQDDEEVFARLAELSPAQYDRERDDAAIRMGIRPPTLDKEVSARRPKPQKEAKGRPVELPEPEPWETPVDGSETLDEAYAALKRHVVMTDQEATAVTLWIGHQHAYTAFAHSPRLMITAPDAECGKTLLMTHLVGSMVCRPLPAEDLSPAPFFRLAEEYRPCFLIDEVDVFIEKDSDLLGAINNGWEPHGCVLRCVGEDNEVRAFSTHAPVVMAGIDLGRKLPVTTISRSIVVSLERASDDELAEEDEYDRRKHQKGLHDIASKLARWTADNLNALHRAEPKLPPKVRNRLADKWRPLFAVAEVAGGHWPELARQALHSQPDLSEPSKALQLLIDIKTVVPKGDEKVATTSLIKWLCEMEDSVWKDYNFKERDEERQKITSRQLAALLKRYKVHPKTVRTKEKNVVGKIEDVNAKGYDVADLERARKKYASKIDGPPVPPKKSVTTSQPSNGAGSSGIHPSHAKNDVTDGNRREPSNGAGCDGVTDNLPLGARVEGANAFKPRNDGRVEDLF